MTDISALESYAGQLSEAAQLSLGAAEKQHQYIHGDAATDVVTESGPVPTIAKQARLSLEQTAGLQLELASADDAAKGANLIGDKGTTVSAALALNLRKPRKVFSRLFAAASSISHLRVVILGDSLAGAKTLQLNASLDRRMGGVNMSGVNSAGAGSGEGTPTGGYDLSLNTASLVTAETFQYQYWPTGLVSRLNDGASALWVRSGSSPTFTDVKVYYIKEPSAGTLNLSRRRYRCGNRLRCCRCHWSWRSFLHASSGYCRRVDHRFWRLGTDTLCAYPQHYRVRSGPVSDHEPWWPFVGRCNGIRAGASDLAGGID